MVLHLSCNKFTFYVLHYSLMRCSSAFTVIVNVLTLCSIYICYFAEFSPSPYVLGKVVILLALAENSNNSEGNAQCLSA